MRNRLVILILVNVVIVGATIVLLRLWMTDDTADQTQVVAAVQQKEKATQVLVAVETLNSGVFMQSRHVQWQDWPEEGLSDSYVTFIPEDEEEEAAEAKEQELLGSVVRFGIPGGQPITAGAIVKPGDRGFLSAILEPGYRAISIPVTPTTSNAGLILPGDYIDLIMTHRFKVEDAEGNKSDRRVAETILQNVRLLAMDQNFVSDPASAAQGKTATLQVTPRQAERVALGLSMGELSMILRGLDAQDNPGRPQRTATWDYNASVAMQAPGSPAGIQDMPVVMRGGQNNK